MPDTTNTAAARPPVLNSARAMLAAIILSLGLFNKALFSLSRCTDLTGCMCARLGGKVPQQGPFRVLTPPYPGMADPQSISLRGGGAQTQRVVLRPGREEPLRRRSGAAAKQQLRPTLQPGSRPGTRGPSRSAGGRHPKTTTPGDSRRTGSLLRRRRHAALAPLPNPVS